MLPLQVLRTSRFVRLVVAVITFTALFYSLSRTWESTLMPKPESPVSDTTMAFPTKIWHSARTESLSATQREWVDSWTKKNPFYRQELLTDQSSTSFVREHFSKTRPDIVDVYESLPIPILRADLLRYLIILAKGGVWSDLDVTCEKNVTDWVPPKYQNQNIDMVVGLEFDVEWHGPGTEVASQFCNWVFMAKKSSRNLLVIVDSVVATIRDIAAANGVQVEDLTLDMLPIDVVNVTGPKIMTIALMESLGKLLGREVDDRDFSGIKRPKLVGDVLIMPGVSFAAAQNGYPTDQGDALVSHHYEGSWKKANAEAKARKAQKTGAK
ncbi:uncharacterized protein N7459_000918 [Penicillium hispanicum]|uniref:uncharacterized protein n=1 Tax=Penicillium hispanicum TaxID=1080232 RepID=UPI0025412D95|nr:uncharacterized protein N7459_000918 [Penicillium hispanicum]KAJ5594710.1 hypothetical protein N7459_000918 [Penicillium hispanicum]